MSSSTRHGRMKPSSYYDRIVDVMEELMKFTLLTRDAAPYLTNRLQRAEGKRPGNARHGASTEAAH